MRFLHGFGEIGLPLMLFFSIDAPSRLVTVLKAASVTGCVRTGLSRYLQGGNRWLESSQTGLLLLEGILGRGLKAFGQKFVEVMEHDGSLS